jgi:hypothetical protein
MNWADVIGTALDIAANLIERHRTPPAPPSEVPPSATEAVRRAADEARAARKARANKLE